VKILDNKQVLGIFHLRMEGVTLRDIAEQSGISRQYAMNILNRSAYKDVAIPERLINIAANHMPLKRAKALLRTQRINELHNKGFAQVEIARKLQIGTATVCRTLQAV